MTHFQHIVLHHRDPLDCTSIVLHALAACPMLESIQLTQLQIKIISVHNKRMADVLYCQRVAVTQQLALLNDIPIPIRAYCPMPIQQKDQGELVALQRLVERHGSTLQVLRLALEHARYGWDDGEDARTIHSRMDANCLSQLI